MSTLRISDLHKTYPNGVRALVNVNLECDNGMLGLLGPNGAGKSSLMRTIATLQQPDRGTLYFDDIDILANPMELRRHLGYLPQTFGVYPRISARELLHYFARLKGIHARADRRRAVDRVLEISNLTEAARRHVSTYSGGMKQRFGIAQLLLADPRLVIVDEPTAGLDPAERHRFLEVLRAVGQDKTVIFSTHIVEDIRERCTDLAIMNGGRLLLRAHPSEAVDDYRGKIWTRLLPADAPPPTAASAILLSSRFKSGNFVEYRVCADRRPGPDYQAVDPKLEDVFFLTVADVSIPA